MNQIDQDPRDYRPDFVKNEPVFAPGGAKRLGAFGIALIIGAVVTILVGIAMSPLEPAIRGLIHSLF